ncbi:hypothetical protein BASA61_010206 [Batrachochytrium salamandrivorans]|nr:hypothetical protein BASA61_010206 [Batrachochytrium salamandrivorans]
MFILQAAAVYPAQLRLAAPLIVNLDLAFSPPWSRNTPRQISDAYYPSILTCINYGIVYPGPIMIFVIGVVYAPISPLILHFAHSFCNGLLYFQGLKASADGGALQRHVIMGHFWPSSFRGNAVVGIRTDGHWGSSPACHYCIVYWWLNNGMQAGSSYLLKFWAKVAAELIRNMPEQSSDTASSSHPNFIRVELGMTMECVHEHNGSVLVCLLLYYRQRSLPVVVQYWSYWTSTKWAEEESLLLSALDQEECISLGIHLEPPMTRVPGILDAPVQSASSILRYGDEVRFGEPNTMVMERMEIRCWTI